MAKTPPVVKKCGNCVFFDTFSETEGRCYRYPPTILVSDSVLTSKTDPVISSARPVVSPECRACGEYAKK